MMGFTNYSAPTAAPLAGVGVGMMAGNGLTSMLSVMQTVVNGGAIGSTGMAGIMQSMLDVMDDFLPGSATGTAAGSSIFQGMATAMNRVLTGSTHAPASFQTMLDAMHGFLATATSASPATDSAFQTMLDAMSHFVASETAASSLASQPLQSMLGAMNGFLSSANSGASTVSASFQTMLATMSSLLADTNILSGPAAIHSRSLQADGSIQVSGPDGIAHSISGMERLNFTDLSVAFDINGHAGEAAKILGMVFGADSVANKSYVGMGLNLLDAGLSYQEVMQAALNARLGDNFTTADEVRLAYHNLLGTEPSASTISYWEQAVASGQYTPATLAVMAAETAQNASNINLVGLAHTGLEYWPMV